MPNHQIVDDFSSMTTPPRRRWFRFAFSLRTLFVCLTLLALVAAWVAHERRESQRQLQTVADLGYSAMQAEYGGRFDASPLADNAQPMWRQLLRSILGVRVLKFQLNATRLQDLSPLAELKDLRQLYIFNPKISDLTPLAKLTDLEDLSMNAPKVDDISPLASLGKLSTLDLHGTQVSDVSPLAGLKKLESLTIKRSLIRDVSPLSGLENLKFITLEDSRVSDVSPLAALPDLIILSINSAPVSDITSLAELRSVQLIRLYSTKVSKEQAAALQQALPGCQFDLGLARYSGPDL